MLTFFIPLQLVHTLSVSLNKIGDLRYYDGNLESARSYYTRALDVRRDAIGAKSNVSSQVSELEGHSLKSVKVLMNEDLEWCFSLRSGRFAGLPIHLITLDKERILRALFLSHKKSTFFVPRVPCAPYVLQCTTYKMPFFVVVVVAHNIFCLTRSRNLILVVNIGLGGILIPASLTSTTVLVFIPLFC